MRGLLTIESEKKFYYIDKFYEAYWAKNLDLKDQNTIKIILEDMGIDHKKFLDDIASLSSIESYLSERPELIDVSIEPKLVINGKAHPTGTVKT